MNFGNPVPGVLHVEGWNRPSGNTEFEVTQRFGCTGVSYERPLGNCAHYHRGIDFWNGHCGGAVLAANSGTVHWAGRDTFGSIDVELDHGGGWFTAYAHLSRELVSQGQHVTKGQIIGYVGDTGNSTACHLHFAVKSGASASGSILGDGNGTFVDPWPLLTQNTTPVPAVKIYPKGPGINIRSSAGSGSTLGPLYATTNTDGTIRLVNGTSLGLTSTPRSWGGTVTGASYPAGVGYAAGNKWEKIYLNSGWRYIATPLSIKA